MAIENNTDYTLKGSQVLDLRDYVYAAMSLPGTVIGSGAPTTTTEGNVGQFYYDTTNDKFYQCEAKTAQGTTPETYLYTWTLQVSGPTVVQTTGTSTTDVMSQNAVTSMVFADPSTKRKVRIGNTNNNGTNSISIGASGAASGTNAIQIGSASANSTNSISIGTNGNVTRMGAIGIGANTTVHGDNAVVVGPGASSGFESSVAIGQSATVANGGGHGVAIGHSAAVRASSSISLGYGAETSGTRSIAIGNSISASGSNSVAIGAGAYATVLGQFDISAGGPDGTWTYGYNSSAYRLLTGLYDPQNAHDAATKGYVDGLVGNVAAALNVINNGGSN